MVLSVIWITILTVLLAPLRGQTITPVYVQINVPVTLTCPADDQATTLTWTGPGGYLWATGTTVEDGVNGGGTSRISADHSGGSYTLTFTRVRATDTGIYTCTVDGAVRLQMVIVQGVTSASLVYITQGGTVTLQCTDTGGTIQWQVSSPSVFTYTLGTQLNPSLPESTKTRLSVTRQDGKYNLQISDVQLSDVREYICNMGTTNTFYHLLLYITPTFPVIENTVTVDSQNRTTGTEDGSLTLTCNALGGTPASSVSWIKDGGTLMTSNNTVQYTRVFTRADDRNLFTCQSSSPALASPQTTRVLVYLDLKPQQPTVSDPSSQTENSDLQVVCVSTGSRPAADIEWNVGGTWLSSNPEELKVLDTSTDTYTVTSSLSRRVTRQDNGKSVYCRVSNRALSGGIESVRQTITVLFGPDSVSITGNRVVVADGTDNLTLTCTTQEYNRHVHIPWYNGTTRIPNTAAVTNTSGSYGGFISTQVLQLVPDRYQDGNVVRCVVQNEDVTLGERTASVTLDVRYQPYLTLTPNQRVNVVEGENLEIRCDVDSNPSPSSVTWSKVGGQLPPDADVTSGVLRIPSTHRTDRGTYQCTAVNSVGTGQSSLVTDILFPPDIRVLYTNSTYTVTDRVLTCVPDGNPASYQFGQWRHTAEDGTEIRQLTGSSNTTHSVLTLPDPGMTRRYEDTGFYTCTASNNIPGVSTSRTGSIFFVVEAPPVISMKTSVIQGEIGASLTINVEFYSRPVVNLGDVIWTKGSAGLSPSDAFAMTLGVRSIETSLHGIDVAVEGFVAVMSTNSLSKEDSGDYTVTVNNRIGMDQYTFTLSVTGPPPPPLYLLQKQVTEGSITIQWAPGPDEGSTQSFVIGYKSDPPDGYTDLVTSPEILDSVMSYTIGGLAADTVYYIRIYAQNDVGMSKQLHINCSTSVDKLHSTRVALIVVSTFLVLVVIGVVASIVIFRIRKTQQCFRRNNTTTKHHKRDQNDFLNNTNQLSTYEELNLASMSPPSVYEDIRSRDEQPNDNNRLSQYEMLNSATRNKPSVYDSTVTQVHE